MILVFGYLGFVTNQLDGQTVQTRSVLKLLQDRYGNKVDFFDSQMFKKNPLTAFIFIYKLSRCRHLFYLPGQNNIRITFPFISLLTFTRLFDVHYIVIGGWLPEFLEKRKLLQWCTKRAKAVYVYMPAIEKKLKDLYSLQNLVILPNFRITGYRAKIEEKKSMLRLVFMSRIVVTKGLDVIFRFSERWQARNSSTGIIIDFYGPVDKSSSSFFFGEITKFPFLAYKGELQPEDIYHTLNQYDVLILPTRYEGEGLPGAIVDAYLSGIPVIASDWKYNSEIVEHGKTGFLFSLDEEEKIDEHVQQLIDSHDLLIQMKKNALKESRRYSADFAAEIIGKELKVRV